MCRRERDSAWREGVAITSSRHTRWSLRAIRLLHVIMTRLRYRVRFWCEGSMAQESLPVAVVAPARPEPGHEQVPPLRADSYRWRVTVGTAIALGKHKIEEHCRHDETHNDKCHKHNGEQRRIGHGAPLGLRTTGTGFTARKRRAGGAAGGKVRSAV